MSFKAGAVALTLSLVFFAGSPARAGSLFGDTATLNVGLTGNLLFENPQPTYPQMATVGAGVEFGGQLDDSTTQNNGGEGVTFGVDVGASSVIFSFIGSTNFGGTFTDNLDFGPGVVISNPVLSGGSFFPNEGTFSLIGSGPHSVTLEGTSNTDFDAVGGVSYTLTFDVAPAATPEPASLTLLGLGVAGMFGYGWRRRRAA